MVNTMIMSWESNIPGHEQHNIDFQIIILRICALF